MSKRKNVMLCYPLSKRRFDKWGGVAIAQPKLDGERCLAWPVARHPDMIGLHVEEQTTLRSSSDAVIDSIPHIRIELDSFFTHTSPNFILDGELHAKGLNQNQIHSILSRKNTKHPRYQDIKLNVFDLAEDSIIQDARIKMIQSLKRHYVDTGILRHINVVQSILVTDFSQVNDLCEHFIEQGFEGIILRRISGMYEGRRSTNIMKFKPTESAIYRVIKFIEEKTKNGVPKNRLGSIQCVGDDGVVFYVGSGLTEKERIEWWTNDPPPGVEVKFQHLHAGSGRPRSPVFVRFVKE